jgi:thiol-disulfide isomerase/thioredoxin
MTVSFRKYYVRHLFVIAVIVATMQSAYLVGPIRADDSAEAAPAHQVVACYFHRTNRCPTCKKISSYIEEAVDAGFADEIKAGTVKVKMVDFQDAKNQKLTEAYKITGPTLVLMDIHDGKVKSWKPAPKVWSLVGKKNDFFKYVQQELKGYLTPATTDAK